MPKRNYKKSKKKGGGNPNLLQVPPNSNRTDNTRPRTSRVRIGVIEVSSTSRRSPTRNINPPLRSSLRRPRSRFSLSPRTRKSKKGSIKKPHNP